MIVRVHVQSWVIKGKDTGMGGQVTLVPLFDPKTLSQQNFTAMSADPNTPLFVISDGDDIEYEDDLAVTQVKVNLVVVAECLQQEKAEQRRLERVEWKVWAEAE